MGVCIALPSVVPRRQCSSGARFAGGLQRRSLRGEDGLSVALGSWRSAALGGGLSADASLAGGCFEALVADVQLILREWAGKKGQPTAVCLDSRTLQSTPESGARAGYDGAKRRKGSKVHIAVDTLGHLLALKGHGCGPGRPSPGNCARRTGAGG